MLHKYHIYSVRYYPRSRNHGRTLNVLPVDTGAQLCFLPEDLESCTKICTLELSLYRKISSCSWCAVWFCLEYRLVAPDHQRNVLTWVGYCNAVCTGLLSVDGTWVPNKYIVTSYVESWNVGSLSPPAPLHGIKKSCLCLSVSSLSFRCSSHSCLECFMKCDLSY
jgi:hypothetical protein